MTSGPAHRVTTATAMRTTEHSSSPLRLALKPVAPPTGHVDGAWWPRSRDLRAELPALAEALADRIGAVSGVVFASASWTPAPPRVELGGRTVALVGFASSGTDVVQVRGADRRRVDLLVVPPEADALEARDAMVLAAGPDDARRPAELLASVTSALFVRAQEPLQVHRKRLRHRGAR